MADYPFRTSEASAPPMEAPTSQGSILLGILGALLGALAGAIPWFFASTFAGFFIGWLGFLVGWMACWGYRKLGGFKSTGFATATVIAASFLALLIAEFASWMYVLCTDSSWLADAAYWGIPIQQMVFESLLMPENWPRILPSLGLGMLIGLLGVFSARTQMLQYTDPEKAAQLARGAASNLQYQAAAAATTGFPLPQSFTVRMKSTKKLAYVVFGLAGVFFILFLILGFVGEWDGMPIGIALSLFLILEGVFILFVNRRYRLEVDGEQLRFVTRLGKVQAFTASDIAGVSVTNALSRTLYGRDGQVLAKLNQNMENMVLINQYLMEHNVPLRGL